MRLEWQYSFTSTTLRFDKQVSYAVTIQNQDATGSLKGLIQIRPKAPVPPDTRTSGVLHISLPLSLEDGTPVAHRIASEFEQRMAFEHGDFRINWAVLTCERIPETPEEGAAIGDLTHHILRIALEVVPGQKEFPPDSLQGALLHEYNLALLQLFNNAERKTDPIDRFLTRFKILEADIAQAKSKHRPRRQLKRSAKLRTVFFEVCLDSDRTVQAFEFFIDRLVTTRDRCAHLREYKYGFLPGDPALDELKGIEGELREICRRFIVYRRTS